jgi:drug/metabolite transporter (DMT)-like permease
LNLAAGVLVYRESLSPLQVAGILLAIGGVVLINWP